MDLDDVIALEEQLEDEDDPDHEDDGRDGSGKHLHETSWGDSF